MQRVLPAIILLMNFIKDPLNEKAHEVLPGLIRKYKNRVLLITTKGCPSRCEFCFRKDLYERGFKRAENSEIIKFVGKNKEIKEFIFSGGEPLIVPDQILGLTKALNKIHHLKIFRIHTRLPITFPERVDLKIMERIIKAVDKPVYLVIHVNSPSEISQDVSQALLQLRKLGYILLSHTVFLKGVNDNIHSLEELFTRLIELGIKPYYIFHCDNMVHTQKFIVPLKKEIEIMTELRKRLSGLAYPLHVIDSESGNGKIPVPTGFWNCNCEKYKDFED